MVFWVIIPVMKSLVILLFSVVFAACSAQAVDSRRLVSDPEPVDETKARTPVLVELFTSEGCSSCPAAERLLAEFQSEQPFENVELITMALHVDYWDALGWKDRFASPLFTQRQRVYDRKFKTGRIYTPQMVVDGDIEFVGSNRDKARKAISKAVKSQKAAIDIEVKENKLKIAVSDLPRHDDATVYLAFVEDNLSSSIKRGENAGKDLTHVSVVRALNGLGRIGGSEDSFEIETAIQTENDWKRENINLIVFVQENQKRNILGVKRLQLP